MSKTSHRYRTTQRAKSPPRMSYTRKANGEYVYKPLNKTQREKSLRHIRKHLEKRARVPKEDTDLLVNFRNNAHLPPPPTEAPPQLEVGVANALMDLKRGKYDGKSARRTKR